MVDGQRTKALEIITLTPYLLGDSNKLRGQQRVGGICKRIDKLTGKFVESNCSRF